MKKKSFKTEILLIALETLLLAGIALLFICPVSCKITELGIRFVPYEYDSPSIQSFSVRDSSSASLVFSRSVRLSEIKVVPENSVSSVDYGSCGGNGSPEESGIQDGNGNSGEGGFFSVVLNFSEPLEVGEKYTVCANATDDYGNSLSFSLPFVGFNPDVALLEITEVHPKYAGESKGNGIFKNEYVLFKAKKSGNLSGLRFFSANDGTERAYDFPSVNVKSGEKIALHLRKKGEGCFDELEDNLDVSSAYYSKSDGRDLWAENEKACLGDLSDVLVLENMFSSEIVDAVLYSSSDALDWKNDFLRKTAARVCSEGFWKGDGTVVCAFKSDGITASKSFIKSEGKNGGMNSASLWKTGASSLK